MGGVRTCYLCDYKYNKNVEIALHHFPNKFMYTYKRWLNVCGLNERDDVSCVYVCTRHFKPTDFSITNKRIKLHHGAVPSIDVPNPVVENLSSIPSENISKNIVLDNIYNESLETVANPTSASSVTIDDRIEVQSNSQNSNIGSDEEQLTLQKRRFAQPRYISEIQLFDVATPLRAIRTLKFIKATDEKKSKEIAHLKSVNRKLNRQIVSLKRMMYHLHKKKD